MADVESTNIGQRQGRVHPADQVMTPCPSPDEAMRLAGEVKEQGTNTQDVGDATNRSDDIMDIHPDGAVTTADGETAISASPSNNHLGRNHDNTIPNATSPAASASTINNEPGDQIVAIVEADPKEQAVGHMAEELDIIHALQKQHSSESEGQEGLMLLSGANRPAEKDAMDIDFIKDLDQGASLESQLAQKTGQEIEKDYGTYVDANIRPDLNGITYVDGGFWGPPESAPDDPPIEAFAKLEFNYGQDFYMSTLNVVIGRPEKQSTKKSYKKAKYRTQDLCINGVPPSEEVKVPVFPPSNFNIASISRKHVRVFYNYEKSTFMVTPLCEKGITLLRNGQESRKYINGNTFDVHSGDMVKFGPLSFTFYLPDPVGSQETGDDAPMADDATAASLQLLDDAQELSSELDSDNDSDDGDDEDDGSDDESGLGSREASNEFGTPNPRTVKLENGDSALMPPPPIKRGRGRPPKNGISVREQKLLKRQAQEEFIANGGNVANLDMSKYGNLPVEKLFAKEGEKMQMQAEKEARKKQKLEEKEAKIREKQAAKDLKPQKLPKERKRKRSKSPPPREEDYLPEQLMKPTIPYTVMIYDAIESSESKALTLPEIYRSLEKSHPYFKVKAETTGWQSSVRHNLRGSGESGSPLFERGEKAGKGYVWKIAPGANIEKERKKRRTAASPPAPKSGLQTSPVPSSPMVPGPSGNWSTQSSLQGQSSSAVQPLQQQFRQQPSPAQSHPQGTDPRYGQANYQVQTTPTQSLHTAKPPVARGPIPTGYPIQANSGTRQSPSLGTYSTAQRPAAHQAPIPPPPPSWDPSQHKQQTRVSLPNNSTGSGAPIVKQTPAAAIPQVQSTHVQHQQQQPQQHQSSLTVSAGSTVKLPIGSSIVVNKSSVGPGLQRVSTQPAMANAPPAASEIDVRAKELVNNVAFQKVLRETIAKNPKMRAQESIRLAYAEFRKLGKVENLNGPKVAMTRDMQQAAPIPKPPMITQRAYVAQHPQQQNSGLQPVKSTFTPQLPSTGGAPVVAPKPPAISTAPVQPPKPAAAEQVISTPVTPISQPKPSPTSAIASPASKGVSNFLKTCQSDPDKKAKMLEFLRNLKEKKSADTAPSNQPTNVAAGVKRTAEQTADGQPMAKRPTV